MIEWFKNLSEGWQIAIFGAGITVGLVFIGGVFKLFKCLFNKGTDSLTQQKNIHQKGTNHTAANIDGDKNIVAGRDIHITGLLPKSKIDDGVPIGPGLGSIAEITHGSITYRSNTLNIKPFIGLKMSIVEGHVKRNDFGKLEAYIRTDIPFQSLQRLNEQLGLDSMRLLSESDTVSEDRDNPTVFTSSTSHILPQGEMVLNLLTWQEVPLFMNIHVQTQTTASGYLMSKVFQGEFEAVLTYRGINLQIGLNGDFQAHLT